MMEGNHRGEEGRSEGKGAEGGLAQNEGEGRTRGASFGGGLTERAHMAEIGHSTLPCQLGRRERRAIICCDT